MMRSTTLLLVALLSACSSGGSNKQIISAALDELLPGKKDDAPKAAPTRLTRAAVDASGAAMIRARLVEERGTTLLSAASDNGGYVTFASSIGQTLTLRGSLVTASRGLGYDLLSVEASASDPLVRPTPLSSWPQSLQRTYRFPGIGPAGTPVTVSCRYEPEQSLEIEIVEVTHRGRQVAEYCAGDGVSFKNLHFVAEGTGFVWRSLQWLGPDQGSIDLEIVEPYTQ